MSYYFGIVLSDLVILGTDRYKTGKAAAGFFPLERIKSVGKNFALCAGNLIMSSVVLLTLPEAPAEIGDLFRWNSYFPQRLIEGYSELKSMIGEKLFRDLEKIPEEGVPAKGPDHYENVDILWGGFLGDGNPFLATISSVDNFALKVLSKVGFIALQGFPGVLPKVNSQISNFFKVVSNSPVEVQKTLGKRMLPNIIHGVADHVETTLNAKMVTHDGDLIFLTRDGFEVFGFDKRGNGCPASRISERMQIPPQ